jgi:hypothetical protein
MPEPKPEIRRGTRFRAFPGREVFDRVTRTWAAPTYRVTSVQHYEVRDGQLGDRRTVTEVFYRVDDAGRNAQAHCSLTRLIERGLEIIP